MYNYQQWQKQQKINNTCQTMYSSFLKENQYRKQLNKSHYNNHKKRVDTFIVSAIQKPVQITKHINTSYNPRAFLMSSTVGKQPFKMNSHTSTQRIQDVSYKNSFLDGVPFTNSSLHKFRDSSANTTIHKQPIKFTASCTAMRLMQDLARSRLNQVELLESNSPAHYRRFSNKAYVNKGNSRIENKNLNKLIMPTLNRKVYMNSMKSVLVEQSSLLHGDSLQDKDISDTFTNTNNKYDADYSEKESKKNNNKIKKKAHQIINRKENALMAMVKCGIIKQKEGVSNIRA